MPTGVYIRITNKGWFKKGKDNRRTNGFKKGNRYYELNKGKRLSPTTEFKKGHKDFNTKESHRRAAQKISGEKNYGWKGDNVGMAALHRWLYRKLGRPQKCEYCGVAEEKRMYHWANKSHYYKRELTDWIRLCVPCHRKYDYNFRKSGKD